MATNIEITKSGNENTGAVLRKFTQRMRSSGIVQKMRKIRYRARPVSKNVQRKDALRKIEKREKMEQLVKEGKIAENTRGRRGRFGK